MAKEIASHAAKYHINKPKAQNYHFFRHKRVQYTFKKSLNVIATTMNPNE